MARRALLLALLLLPGMAHAAPGTAAPADPSPAERGEEPGAPLMLLLLLAAFVLAGAALRPA